MDEQPVGVSAAARLAGTSRKQVLRWVEQGKLTPAGTHVYAGKEYPAYLVSDVQRLRALRKRRDSES